jgi:sigma-B regulation protein RsbU (phosphoserine phosphatase)
MTAVERAESAGVDLGAVIDPFRALGSSVAVAIVDSDGAPIATTTAGPVPTDARVGTIPGGPLAGCRVFVWGDGSASGLQQAVADSLAAALAVASAAHADADARLAATARLIESELAHGRRLQRSFVSLEPPDVPGFEIAAHYEAAREIGGDFFELFRLRRRGRPLSVVIADVTGKGIAAALLMAFARPLLHAAIDHTKGPAEALERTNRILIEERRSSLFITALAARLDVRTGDVCIANAGHEPPLLVRADRSPIEFLAGSGALLGAYGQLDLPIVRAVLQPGDLLLLYTDGVTDARSPAGERFEETRLVETIEAARGGSATDIVSAVCGAVGRFQAAVEPADDITIVAIRRMPAA